MNKCTIDIYSKSIKGFNKLWDNSQSLNKTTWGRGSNDEKKV